MEIINVSRKLLPAIAEIERQCFSTPWSEAMLATQLKDGHIFLAAVENGSPVGYVGLAYVLDEGYISNIAVSPLYRRRGIASALLTELEKRSRALELTFMTLEVRAGNASAIALYAKHGFVPVGHRKNYYENPREDAILMTLELKNNANIQAP
jgi:ribosomal-protein-alanine N-acetyltransferase